MKLKTAEAIFGIFLAVVMFSVVVWMFFLMGNQLSDSILMSCYEGNWKNITLQGDFAGEIDCNQFYIDNYKDNWTSICSSWFFSDRPDCHTLCNIDCDYNNKHTKPGEPMCVC